MRTKEELLAEMRRRERAELSHNMSPSDYMRGIVSIMFDVTAETLADLRKETEK